MRCSGEPARESAGRPAHSCACEGAHIAGCKSPSGRSSPACDRRLLRRGDTRWGAAGGESSVRNIVSCAMRHRELDSASRRDEPASAVRSPTRSPCPQSEGSPRGVAGDRVSERVLNQTVDERKAVPSPEGGWRWNDGKRECSKQGNLSGSDGVQAARGGPKSRPAGGRASVVARKRVTTVEPRDAGKWKP